MSKSGYRSYGLLFILSLIWGSSFILMKKGMLTYSPSQVASMRIVFAGIVFVPFVIKSLKNIPWQKYKYILLFGLLEVGIPPYLYTFAQTHVDSSTAGILNSLVPIFTLLTGLIFFKIRYRLITSLGVLAGLFGAFLMTYFNSTSKGFSFDITNSWGLLIVLATLLYGIGGNLLNEKLNDVSGSLVTALAFVSLAIPAAIYLLTTDFLFIPLDNAKNFHSFLSILLLSVFGSALAILIFSKLIKLSDALFASFVTWLIPFVSLIWGWADGENISLIHFSGMAVIFVGIYFANYGDKTKANKVKHQELN